MAQLLNGWRSMDSAPKDKETRDGKDCEPIMAWTDKHPAWPVELVWWLNDSWTNGENYYEEDYFSAWQPIPEGPR